MGCQEASREHATHRAWRAHESSHHMFAAALRRAPLRRAPLRILSPVASKHRLTGARMCLLNSSSSSMFAGTLHSTSAASAVRLSRSLSTPRTLTERRPLRQDPVFIDFHGRIRSSLTTLLTTLTTLEVDEAPASDRYNVDA